MRNTKKSFLYHLMTSLLIFALLVTSVFAWYYIGDNVNNMEYSIMKINSSVDFYLAVDENYNGVPNLLPTPVKSPYYMEKYKFTEQNLDVPALSYDSTFNVLTKVNLEKVLPSKIYTLKYSLLNKSSVPNRINFLIQKGQITNSDLFSTLSFKAGYVTSPSLSSEGTVNFGEKIYGFNIINNGSVLETSLPMKEQNVFIKGTFTEPTPENYGDFWIQIEMEPYEELQKLPNFQMTREQYLALQGVSLDLPFLHVNFEVLDENAASNY